LDYQPSSGFNPKGLQNLEVLVGGDDLQTAMLTSVDIHSLLSVARQFWLDHGALASTLSSVTVSVDDLPAQTVAQTQGSHITISSNAAGWGWFVDATPRQHEEFTRIGDTLEYRAQTGSEAENKVDLLGVLIHELGHVLGLEHSDDARDEMAAIIIPGLRRLPDLDADEANASGFGRVVTSSITSTRTSTLPRYENAAHPELTNPAFAGETGGSVTGDVAFTHGAAILNESADTQTRLNQSFMLGENDRYLSFTLTDLVLDDVSNAPDDAFEVALLDANTGLSLLDGTGLTRNDAFLNLQANGDAHNSSRVTRINNADGSQTVLVDLEGIDPGTLVNLSFDLIGFGRGAAASDSFHFPMLMEQMPVDWRNGRPDLRAGWVGSQ
jgi:hypothetical protein